ncbi:unnamed protein product [Fusarium graminearum]|nr:unnamed protein product [Fusarium graminearum]
MTSSSPPLAPSSKGVPPTGNSGQASPSKRSRYYDAFDKTSEPDSETPQNEDPEVERVFADVEAHAVVRKRVLLALR